MTFMTNDSPFVGRDGEFVTARKIEERLYRETQKDVSLKVETSGQDSWVVSGRGKLHLSILIENLKLFSLIGFSIINTLSIRSYIQFRCI